MKDRIGLADYLTLLHARNPSRITPSLNTPALVAPCSWPNTQVKIGNQTNTRTQHPAE